MSRSALALCCCLLSSIALAQTKSDYGFTLTTPVHLLYLEQDSIRAELKLNKEQTAKIDAIQKNWIDSAKHIDLERGTISDDASSLATHTRKSLGTILTADQMKRIDQIILRHREREYGLPAVLSTLTLDLQLNEEQKERLDALRHKRAELILEHLTSGERLNAVRRDIYEANADFVDRVTALLTKEQQSRLKDLLGEPFAGPVRLSEPTTVIVTGKSGRSIYFGDLWNRYGLEAEILKNESVHKELKLTGDQIRKAKEFNVEWWTRYENRRKDGSSELAAVDGLGSFVMVELKAILTKEQRSRFDQIAMQYRENVAGPGAGLGYPARSSLDLVIEQLDRIKEGVPVSRELNERQQAEYRQMLGERFAGELKITSPLKITVPPVATKPNVVRPHVETNRATLARFMLDNARRYRLDAEQTARLKAIDEDLPALRKLLHRELSQLPPPTTSGAARTMIPEAKAVESFRKSIFEQCFDVLDKRQQSLWGAELRRARASIIDY